MDCNLGPCTSTSFSGLPIAGQVFYVFPHNAGGYGSAAVSNTVTPKTIPSAPTNAVATAQPDGRVKVSWTLSSSDGGATMGVHVIYVFRRLANGTFEYTNQYSTPCATCTEDFFSDLTVGTTYKFYVYATNTVGHNTTAAETNTVVVTAPVPTVPPAPLNPQATLDGSNVDVTWTAPPGRPDITDYRASAHLATTDAAVGNDPPPCGATCTSIEFTGLTAGTAYRFKIYAINSVGDSPAAVTGTVTIPDDPDPTVPFAPVNVQAVGSSSQVVVTWQPAPDQSDGTPGDGGSPVTGHRIMLDPPCGGCTGKQVSGETFSTNLVGLAPGATYVITVIATNSVGDSSPSVPIQFTADAEAPGAPTITEIIAGDGAATVKWNPPSELNGSTITGYVISTDPACESCQGLQVSDPNARSAEVSGMINKTEYSVRIQATASEPSALSDPEQVIPHHFTYAALGDSYSSGQGAPVQPSEGSPQGYDLDEACLRSSNAYAPLVKEDSFRNPDLVFLACAGRTVPKVRSDQIPDLPKYADVVTITIGGNDLGFGDVLRYCNTHLNCQHDFPGKEEEILNYQDELEGIYRDIQGKAKNARLVVLTYPQVLTADTGCPGDSSIEEEEKVWIRQLAAEINRTIIDAAANVDGVEVIRLGGPDEPQTTQDVFDGHEVCSSDPWINGYDLDIDGTYDRSMHPNEEGYQNMAARIVGLIG